jgi:hypothetical protein
MSMQILKGIYARRAGGSTQGTWSIYDFIEIGGKRIEKVAVDDTLDVFLDENHGKAVEASFVKSGGLNILCAMRCSDGKIERVPMRKVNLVATISGSAFMGTPTLIVGMIVGVVIFGGPGVFIGSAAALGLWIALGPARRSGDLGKV